MMSYTPKIVGTDEKLIGIARLHWIYLAKGFTGLIVCILFGYALMRAMDSALAFIYATRKIVAGSIDTTIAANNTIMEVSMAAGIIIFLCYAIKVLGTEIGLTSKRVIHKEGLIFIKVHEVDIEEIRGASMDLGWFGGILGYAYLKFDCRFVGDVRTPAIEKPERFMKALHKMRAEHTDSLTAAPMATATVPEQPEQPPAQPPVQPPAAPPEIPQAPPETPVMPPVPQQPPQAPPSIDPPQQPMKAEAKAQNGLSASPPVDAQLVAGIINQAMPQIIEKVAEEMAAHGYAAKPAEEAPIKPEELLSSFDSASKETPPDRIVH